MFAARSWQVFGSCQLLLCQTLCVCRPRSRCYLAPFLHREAAVVMGASARDCGRRSLGGVPCAEDNLECGLGARGRTAPTCHATEEGLGSPQACGPRRRVTRTGAAGAPSRRRRRRRGGRCAPDLSGQKQVRGRTHERVGAQPRFYLNVDLADAFGSVCRGDLLRELTRSVGVQTAVALMRGMVGHSLRPC